MEAKVSETAFDGVSERPRSGTGAVEPANVRRLERAPASSSELTTESHGPSGKAERPRRSLAAWLALQVARAVLPLALIAAAFAAHQYLIATKPVVVPRPVVETRFPVEAATVEVGRVQPTLEVFGTTFAGREVELRALVAGRVAETGPNLRDGARVEAGETLIRIDGLEYDLALDETLAQRTETTARIAEFEASLAVERANLSFLNDQLAIASDDLRRAEQLSQRGTLADRAVDDRRLVVSQRRQAATQVENSISVWEARIAQQKAALERLAAAETRARQRREETVLVAPFDAYVADVATQVGRMMGINDRVATLIDRDWIEVRFTLSDAEYGRLAAAHEEMIGRPISVEWRIGDGAVRFTGRVERVAPRVSSATGGVELVARVNDPDGAVALRPGAFVTVLLPGVMFNDVISLPAAAVIGQSHVFAIVDGRLEQRAVSIVGMDGERLLVRGQLEAGEQVLLTRLSAAGTGVAVTVVGPGAP
ncbi:MAG: efflux RND transporter periplasmic adaptor subunit [Hyphomicrobiaceae bacterium]